MWGDRKGEVSGTYTDGARGELMLDLALAFVIGGYLILEYSLSFVFVFCKRSALVMGQRYGPNKRPSFTVLTPKQQAVQGLITEALKTNVINEPEENRDVVRLQFY